MAETVESRILRVVVIFGLLRATDAIVAVATMVVSSAATMMLNQEAGWSFRTELGGALLVAEAYYLVFQYLAFSALVFIILLWNWSSGSIVDHQLRAPMWRHSSFIQAYSWSLDFMES